jgi:hypothetical protein
VAVVQSVQSVPCAKPFFYRKATVWATMPCCYRALRMLALEQALPRVNGFPPARPRTPRAGYRLHAYIGCRTHHANSAYRALSIPHSRAGCLSKVTLRRLSDSPMCLSAERAIALLGFWRTWRWVYSHVEQSGDRGLQRAQAAPRLHGALRNEIATAAPGVPLGQAVAWDVESD